MSGHFDMIGQCKLECCEPAPCHSDLCTPITGIRAARRGRYVTTKEPAEEAEGGGGSKPSHGD